MILTNVEKLAIEVFAVLLIVVGFTFYERHKGAQACITANKEAVQIQKTHNADVLKYDGSLIAAIEDSYHAAKSAPILLPPVRLCDTAPRALSRTAAAAVRPDDRPGLPRRLAPVDDPGPLSIALGRDADAQVSALQAYITRVCLGPR